MLNRFCKKFRMMMCWIQIEIFCFKHDYIRLDRLSNRTWSFPVIGYPFVQMRETFRIWFNHIAEHREDGFTLCLLIEILPVTSQIGKEVSHFRPINVVSDNKNSISPETMYMVLLCFLRDQPITISYDTLKFFRYVLAHGYKFIKLLEFSNGQRYSQFAK